MRLRTSTLILLTLLASGEILAGDLQTPLERNDYSRLTSYDEMMNYLELLDTRSDLLSMSIIGKSVQARDLPALFLTLDKSFGKSRETKPVVLIFCQQHGNEPSGKEAALILARNLTGQHKSLLKYLDLILIPQVNPDGAEMGQRRNANNMDLNRNHVILSEPETRALHAVFLKWLPEVTLDVHEYNAITKPWIASGMVKDAEEMLDRVSNLNIDSAIIEFSDATFIPEVGKIVQGEGFRFHRYIVGAPFENQRIRHSTTAINDGRQSMGIYNTLSFIIEGKRYGDLINHIERRTKGQVVALMAFLKTVAQHHAEISEIVRSSRRRLVEESRTRNRFVPIRMDYFPDTTQKKLTYPVFDLYTWRHVEKQLEHYEPVVRVTKSIERPYAYLFSNKEQRLIDLLSRHQIEMHTLEQDMDMEVERYSIMHVTPMPEEDKPTLNVDVRARKQSASLARGSVVVLLNQRAANLIPLLLEPQSSWGIVMPGSGRKLRFAEYLQEGNDYPILRLMHPLDAGLKPFARD